MELFTISCTTCGARLKVRSAAAIGQILKCPRCGSMVLVEPPPGAAPPGAVLTGAAAGGEELPADTDPALTAPSDLATGAEPEQSEAEAQEPADVADGHDWEPGDVEMMEGGSQPQEVNEPASMAEPSSEPVLPGDAWVSPATRQWQQWLLMGSAALAGVAMAVGLVAWYVGRGPSEATVAEAAAVKDDAGAIQKSELSHGPGEPEDAERASEGSDESVAGSSDGQQPQPAERAAEPSSETGVSTEAQQAEGARPETSDLPPTASDGAPPGFEAPPQEEIDTADVSQSLANLQRLTPLLTAASAGEGAEEVQSPDEASPEFSAASSVPAVDVAERLQDPLGQIDFTNASLMDFLRFLTQFSTIPISVDPEALTRLQLAPSRPITVQQQNTDVERALAAALEPLSLHSQVRGDQLWITDRQENEQLQRHSYDIGDLSTGDPQQAQAIAQMVRQLVAPLSWSQAESGVQLEVSQDQLVVLQRAEHHFQIALLLEKLRAARRLPLREELPEALLSPTPRFAQADQLLEQPVRVKIFRPTPLLVVLDRIGKTAGVELLVDWQAVSQRGWHPQLETTLAVHDQPLGSVLEELLEPVKLNYRVLDQQTLEISTPQALRLRPDLEVYSAAGLLSETRNAEQLLEQVYNSLRTATGGQVAGTIIYDAASKHLVASLPQAQQRLLSEQLEQLRNGRR